jgi:hypothetical protein
MMEMIALTENSVVPSLKKGALCGATASAGVWNGFSLGFIIFVNL